MCTNPNSNADSNFRFIHYMFFPANFLTNPNSIADSKSYFCSQSHGVHKFYPCKYFIFANSFFFSLTFSFICFVVHACMCIQLHSLLPKSYTILSKGKIHSQERKYIVTSNCPHLSFAGAKQIGKEWQRFHIKLSTFLLCWNKTNWGKMATTSKKIENNAQKICNRFTLAITVGQIAATRSRVKQKRKKKSIGI